MRKLFIRIRVLPITMFVAALMLSVKIGDIKDSFNDGMAGLPVAKVGAQQPPANTKETDPKKNAAPKPDNKNVAAAKKGTDKKNTGKETKPGDQDG
ncbi:MAG: hypothetical protein HQ503_13655, partial [Rhodospirillales bacterium]|nr:hypothetical protein [Rhodospirillales bacterium]